MGMICSTSCHVDYVHDYLRHIFDTIFDGSLSLESFLGHVPCRPILSYSIHEMFIMLCAILPFIQGLGLESKLWCRGCVNVNIKPKVTCKDNTTVLKRDQV